MVTFYGFNCLKNTESQFTFNHYPPRSFWYSYDQPREDEMLKAELTLEQWFWTWDPLGLGIQHPNH